MRFMSTRDAPVGPSYSLLPLHWDYYFIGIAAVLGAGLEYFYLSLARSAGSEGEFAVVIAPSGSSFTGGGEALGNNRSAAVP